MNPGKEMERDLSKFSDPATEMKFTQGTNTSRFQFTRNGTPLDFLITHSDGSIVARHANNRKYANLRSLLASSDFADLRGFVATQIRMYRDLNPESMIPPEGELDGRRLALQTFNRTLLPQAPEGKTQISIMLLDGPAGVGKTSLIQRLLVQRARGQQDAGSAPPILHVASRGKRLSSLDDVLAQSLQLIRAKFTFDQVPALIRQNLIQLAIDGFDELVDPEGYRDAWFALRDFFETTEFGGPIILAGRDTFFDEQSFAAQMQGSMQRFSVSHARLGEVSPSAAKTWLSARGWKESDLTEPYADLVLRAGSYTLRPYFLQELALAKSWSAIESCDLTPRAYLVDRFVERESLILAENLGIAASDVKVRLMSVFEEVAMEMADTETDAVDLTFLQMVTEFAFGDVLSQTDVGKLRHKSGSFALLVSDTREGYRRFPHTEISHHFLSRALLKQISGGVPVRFLRRGIVSSDLLTILGEQFVNLPTEEAAKFVHALDRLIQTEGSFDRLPDNAASLLLTTLSRSFTGKPRHYSDLQASVAAIFGEADQCRLERVRIQRLSAEEASFINVEFAECEVTDLFADETTRFGVSIPRVHRLHLKTSKGIVRDVFDPAEIEEWLLRRSIRQQPQGNEGAVDLLDKVCRIMLRQHMIKDHESDEHGKVLRHKYWPSIEAILRDAELIDRIHGKQMAGTHAPFVRMRDPYSLVANRQKYAHIWRKVAAIPT